MLTVRQAADSLKLSDRRVRALCNSHGIGTKVGMTWIIDAKKLAAFKRRVRPAHRPKGS